MFLFTSKNKLVDSDFFQGFTDWHSHILPGVDDGAKDLDEALEMLDYFKLLGIKKVFLTPHIKNSLTVNREELLSRTNQLRKYAGDEIELRLSAEYILDSGFEKCFKCQLLYLNDGYVLVETSCLSLQDNFYELLYLISVEGNIPVIAHPERYLYMKDDDYYRLKNNDYSFQLSLLSLSGYYGKVVKKRAIRMLMRGMYDYVGTDIHDLHTFKIWLNKLYVTKEQLNMLLSISK